MVYILSDISSILFRHFVNWNVLLSRTARPFVYSLQEGDRQYLSFSGPFPPSFGQPKQAFRWTRKWETESNMVATTEPFLPKNNHRTRQWIKLRLQPEGSEPDNSSFDHRNSDFGNRDSDFDYRDAGIFIPKEPRPRIELLKTDSYPNPNMRKKSTNFWKTTPY